MTCSRAPQLFVQAKESMTHSLTYSLSQCTISQQFCGFKLKTLLIQPLGFLVHRTYEKDSLKNNLSWCSFLKPFTVILQLYWSAPAEAKSSEESLKSSQC